MGPSHPRSPPGAAQGEQPSSQAEALQLRSLLFPGQASKAACGFSQLHGSYRHSQGFLAKFPETKGIENWEKSPEKLLPLSLPVLVAVAGPWYWALLGAGWVGTAVLTGVVLWLLQRQGERQGLSPQNGDNLPQTITAPGPEQIPPVFLAGSSSWASSAQRSPWGGRGKAASVSFTG